MLKIFRTDIITQGIIILISTLLMWVGIFIHPHPVPIDGGGPIFYWLTAKLSPLAGAIIAYVLVLFQGFLFNSILYRHKMITQNTLMPMFFYCIAMSLGEPTLSPLLLGNTMVILAIGQMMLTTTLLSLTIDKTFAAAALMSIATVFCPAMAVFYVPLIFNMFNYSLYSWRDWTMLVLGICAPYILVETVYYVTDQMFYRNYLLLYEMTDRGFAIHGTLAQWVMSIVFMAILVMGLGAMLVNGQSSTVNYKMNSSAIMIFLLGGFLFTLYASFIPVNTQSYSAPFACCATALFSEPRRKESGMNILFVLLIIASITYNIL